MNIRHVKFILANSHLHYYRTQSTDVEPSHASRSRLNGTQVFKVLEPYSKARLVFHSDWANISMFFPVSPERQEPTSSDDKNEPNYPETLTTSAAEPVIKKEKPDEEEHRHLEKIRHRLSASPLKRPRSEDSGVCLSPTSLAKLTEANGGPSSNKRLRPDPVSLMCKAFPNHNRNVLETIYRGCAGNVVQAIEFILENQNSSTLPMLPGPVPNFRSDSCRDGIASAFRRPDSVTIRPDAVPIEPDSGPIRPEVQTTFYLAPRNGEHLMPNIQLAPRMYPMEPSPFSMTRLRETTNNESEEKEDDSFKYCTNCGRKIQLTDNYCGSCGHKISRS